MNFKKGILALTAVIGTSLIVSACGSKTNNDLKTNNAAYPQKVIKIVNILPQGAPPDQVVRKITGIMAKNKGWNFEYENIPSNLGADAVKKVWEAPHDGYTLVGQTENTLGLSVLGHVTTTSKDWLSFEAFQETSAILVNANSSYKTIEDFINYAKQNPGKVKVAHPATGSSFDYKIGVLGKITGVQFGEIKEYIGGNDIVPALEKSEIDAIFVPMISSLESVNSGKIRPLAILDRNSVDFGGNIGKVESITNTYPEFAKYLPLDPVIGLSMPADAPKEVVEEFGKAFEEAMNSAEMSDMINSIYAIKLNLWGENAKEYMSKMESNYTWLSKELGRAKVSPETLKIQKPEWVK